MRPVGLQAVDDNLDWPMHSEARWILHPHRDLERAAREVDRRVAHDEGEFLCDIHTPRRHRRGRRTGHLPLVLVPYRGHDRRVDLEGGVPELDRSRRAVDPRGVEYAIAIGNETL